MLCYKNKPETIPVNFTLTACAINLVHQHVIFAAVAAQSTRSGGLNAAIARAALRTHGTAVLQQLPDMTAVSAATATAAAAVSASKGISAGTPAAAGWLLRLCCISRINTSTLGAALEVPACARGAAYISRRQEVPCIGAAGGALGTVAMNHRWFRPSAGQGFADAAAAMEQREGPQRRLLVVVTWSAVMLAAFGSAAAQLPVVTAAGVWAQNARDNCL